MSAAEIEATLRHPEVTELCRQLADIRQQGRAVIRATLPGLQRDRLLTLLAVEQRALHARIRVFLGTSEGGDGMSGLAPRGKLRPAWDAASTFHW